MNANLFDGVPEFVEVVNSGGFSAAAVRLNRSTSYISKEVNRLEARLGVQLLNRTTRRIALTESGSRYYDRCQQLVLDADAAESMVGQYQETPRGVLRVSAPVSFGLTQLSRVLPEFVSAYPQIQLDIEYNERIVDILAEGIDVAIRVGRLQDSRLVAKKLMASEGVMVASPAYLAKRGVPREPAELAQHDCIAFTLARSPRQWELVRSDGHLERIEIEPRLMCDSAELELTMALSGIGIARMPLYSCEAHLRNGELQSLLDDYRLRDMDIFAIYPQRRFLSAKVRALIDFLGDKFREAAT